MYVPPPLVPPATTDSFSTQRSCCACYDPHFCAFESSPGYGTAQGRIHDALALPLPFDVPCDVAALVLVYLPQVEGL